MMGGRRNGREEDAALRPQAGSLKRREMIEESTAAGRRRRSPPSIGRVEKSKTRAFRCPLGFRLCGDPAELARKARKDLCNGPRKVGDRFGLGDDAPLWGAVPADADHCDGDAAVFQCLDEVVDRPLWGTSRR